MNNMATKKPSVIVKTARAVQDNVKENRKTGVHNRWCHYFASLILKPKKEVKEITIKDAGNPKGTYISNQIPKDDYLDICTRLTEYTKKNNQLPNYVKYGKYHLDPHLLVEILSRIVIYYADNNKLPKYVNANSKVFTEPTSTDAIYKAFVKAFGKVTTFTDALRKIQGKGYGYYFDDFLSNLQVIANLKNGGQKPNCTDICQMMWHVAKGLGYDVRCLQVWCPKDKITHVRLQVKHKKYTDGKWENYDPAAVADGGAINSLWCAGSGSYTIATNPSWFLANVNK